MKFLSRKSPANELQIEKQDTEILFSSSQIKDMDWSLGKTMCTIYEKLRR